MTATGGADAYDAAATAWAAGPARMYARLAETTLDACPVSLTGAVVLDVGAGTAVVAAAALRRGARWAVASDIAPGMLRLRAAAIPAVLADAARLPFVDGAFTLVTAGFCLSHLPAPDAALREWRRVAGALVASTFAPGPPHPAKAAVDTAMARLGFAAPEWYQQVKHLSPTVEDPDSLAAMTRAAGFDTVRVTHSPVDVGMGTPAEIARWRLGMAHLAPWVSSLPESRRRTAIAAAREAVAGLGPVTIDVQVVSAR